MMARHADSPRRYNGNDEDYRRRPDDRRATGRNGPDDRDRDYGRRQEYGDYRNYERRERDDGRRWEREQGTDRDRVKEEDRDRMPERDRYRERNREREREREMIVSRAGPSRRSASPRPRPSASAPRSRSPSGSDAEDKAKPNFAPSGLLAAATKTVKHHDGTSTVLKYHEPPEARKPLVGWRLYVFKGKEQVDLLHIHRQSAYLVGRDRTVSDLTIEHPSCSKQHAVIQYRHVPEKNEFGELKKDNIKPYIMDLESTNGTFVNDEPVPASRYYELMTGDVIKFGESQREYVMLNDEAV